MEKLVVLLVFAMSSAFSITVTVSTATPVCMSPRMVSFEDGWDGFFQQYSSSSYKWTRKQGSAFSQSKDHTLGNGYYLRLDDYSRNAHTLRSPTYLNLKPSSPCSVSFWVNSYGYGGSVDIYLVAVNTTGATISKSLLCTTSISSQSVWKKILPKAISSRATRFYISITEPSFGSHIGIDDISFAETCCLKKLPVISDVRLTPLPTSLFPWEGWLTVLYHGVWGSVCSRYQYQSPDLGKVACDELGFPGLHSSSTSGSMSTKSTALMQSPVLFTIACDGREKGVNDCRLMEAGNSTIDSCNTHQYDVYLRCNSMLNSTMGSVRLVNDHTTNKYEGRVELFTRFGWVSVCDDHWSLSTAGVVCRQLGYGPVLGALTNAYFGEGNSSFVHDEFVCTGGERQLIDCTQSELSNSQCQHREDAGVICLPPVSQPQEVCAAASSFTDGLGAYTSPRQRSSWYTWTSSTGLNYKFDHKSYFPGLSFTDKKSDGQFVYFKHSSQYYTPHFEVKSSLFSPYLIPPQVVGGNCTLSFVFFSNGPASAVTTEAPLIVSVQQGSRSHVVYVSDTKLSRDWRPVSMILPVVNVFRVQFIARFPFNQSLVLAIDKVSFSADCCSNFKNASLNFTSSFQPTHLHRACGVTEFENGLEQFTYVRSSLTWYTSSFGGHKGNFANVYGARANGTLFSPMYAAPNNTAVCALSFWYRFRGYTFNTKLQVLTFQPGVKNTTVFTTWSTYSVGYQWLSATVYLSLDKAKPFQLIFRASFLSTYTSIAIDSIGLSSGCCENQPVSPLRLVNGTSSTSGRLEIFHDGIWGSVCDDRWDMTDAIVACSQLGMVLQDMTVVAVSDARSMGQIWMDEVSCSGFETTLEDCPFVGWGGTDCTHDEDVYLRCVARNSTELYEGKVSLVGSSNHNSGQVQIYHNGEWQPVCKTSFSSSITSSSPANVICHQLGFRGVTSINSLPTGTRSFQHVITSISCGIRQRQIAQCYLTSHRHPDCSTHAGMMYLTCGNSTTTSSTPNPWNTSPRGWKPPPTSVSPGIEGELQFLPFFDGYNSISGEVIIYHNGRWQPICFNSISHSVVSFPPGHLICSQLGYTTVTSLSSRTTYYGNSLAVSSVITSISCTGNEQRVSQCSLEAHYHSSCALHGSYLYITCNSPRTGTSLWEPTLPGETSSPQVKIAKVGIMRPGQGTVYILYNGLWHPVVADSYGEQNNANARVICHELGYGKSDSSYSRFQNVYSSSRYDSTAWPLVLRCSGDEERLEDCFKRSSYYLDNSYILAVSCLKARPGTALPFGAILGIVLGGGAILICTVCEISRQVRRRRRANRRNEPVAIVHLRSHDVSEARVLSSPLSEVTHQTNHGGQAERNVQEDGDGDLEDFRVDDETHLLQ